MGQTTALPLIEPVDNVPDPADSVLFATRIHPHRSLTLRQARIVVLLVAATSVVATLPFVLMGAWPVAGFMGLDVLVLALAFRASFRSAKAYEDVSVTPLDLMLAKVDPRGTRAEWHFNPSWVRLISRRHDTFGMVRLDLVSRGNQIEIAGFLGPDEKASFAERLSGALAEARRGYRYS